MVNISCAAAAATAACSMLGNILPHNASQPVQAAALAGFDAKYGGMDALGLQAPLQGWPNDGSGKDNCPSDCYVKESCRFIPACKLCCDAGRLA